MRKILLSIFLCFVSLAYVRAETLILHTGARVKGEIVFQNEEVVIFRDASGARFQYPRTDVKEILADDPNAPAEEVQDQPGENQVAGKKASILIELAGNASVVPTVASGGGFGVDLLVGSHHIGNRHLFIGGGLGYHGVFAGKETYNFLPVQAALRMPLLEQKHAPVFGVSLGYGIALSKDYVGGLYAGLDFGYRCQINPKTAIGIVFFARFQQAKVTVTETIEEVDFTQKVGRNIVSPGLKFCLYF